jgi:IMP dehydrogenase
MPTSFNISTEVAQKLLDIGVLQVNLLTGDLRLAPNAETLGWEESLGFEHVAIRQKKNLCTSRLEVNTTSEIIKGVYRPIPMIAANMSTVCDANFCIELYKHGALGVMHRAASDEHILKSVEKIAENCQWVAASVGVGESQVELAQKLYKRGANIFFIDIAHGYSDTVLHMARTIKENTNWNAKVVVGNTTNTELMVEAQEVADCIKIGIAQGFACETKNTAGCTEKQFSATLKFKKLSKELSMPYICDGGIREPADMVKAIGAGAGSIMAGSIFARCPESAAEVIEIDGTPNKIYAGMASRYVQQRWKGGLKDGTCPEGGVRHLKVGEPLEPFLKRWSGALKSGITYAGGNDIQSFQETVEFLKIKA